MNLLCLFSTFLIGISACLCKSIPIHEKVMLDMHYIKQKNVSDNKSIRFTKILQLYSRASTEHVRILGKNIDSRGSDGSEHAAIILESNNFGRVQIRGEKSNRYLCFTKTGQLVGRIKKRDSPMRRCVFREEITSEGYFQYRSVRYPEWFIAFGRHGKQKMGGTTCERPKCRQFVKREVPYRKNNFHHPRRAALILKLLKLQKKLILRL